MAYGPENASQQAAALFTATGYRDTPHAAHYPTAALDIDMMLQENPQWPEEVAREAAITREQLLQNADLDGLEPSAPCDHEHPPEELLEVIEPAFGTLRRSAHGQILGTVLLRATSKLDVQLSCEMLEGTAALMENCATERPEPRYWEKPEDYWNVTPPTTYETIDAARDDVLALFDRVQPDTTIDGVKYFLNGEKLHAFTLLHALEECEQLDQPQLVQAGLGVLSLHRYLSDVHVASPEIPELQIEPAAAALDLSKPETWQSMRARSGDLGTPHALKRLYSMLRTGPFSPRREAQLKTAIQHG